MGSPISGAGARLSAREARGWRTLAPVVLAAACVISVPTYLTRFLRPIAEPYAARIKEVDMAQASDLYIVNADGTRKTRLTADSGLYAWTADWSPDGRQIVFSRGVVTYETNIESALWVIKVIWPLSIIVGSMRCLLPTGGAGPWIRPRAVPAHGLSAGWQRQYSMARGSSFAISMQRATSLAVK